MTIIIVGAGPVGLYTAICLAQRGYTIQMVDKYAGNFTRPGVVAIEAGEIIIRQLQNIRIKVDIPKANSYPETYYIRDIQRVLYIKATELGVKFCKAHFEGIEGSSIYLLIALEKVERLLTM